MGRFRALHDEDSDVEDDHDDEDHCPRWDFVGDDALGEQDALVSVVRVRESLSTTKDNVQTTTANDNGWQMRHERQWESIRPYQWEDEPKRGRSYKLFYLSILIALIARFWKDPPPAPPPPTGSHSSSSSFDNNDELSPIADFRSWSDYITQNSQQLTESVTALGIHTPWHVVTWLGASLATDVQLLYEMMQRKLSSTDQCQVSLLSMLHDQTNTDLQHQLLQAVVGQPLAIEWLSDAVHAWSSSAWSVTSAHENDKNAPLVVLATGYAHTGKRTVALELASQFTRASPKCASAGTTTKTLDKNILHLKGSDWKLEVYDYDSRNSAIAASRLFRKLALSIESHIHRFRSGSSSVILLTNVENMEASILARLLLALSDDSTNADNPLIPDLHQLCLNSLVYMTSDSIGVTPITRSLRASGGNLVDSAASLAGDLKNAVQHQLGNVVADTITLIIPFGPFTPYTLAQLFRRRVELYSESQAAVYWKQFVVTDAAVAAFTDDRRVEYLEWRSKQQQPRQHHTVNNHGSKYSHAVAAARSDVPVSSSVLAGENIASTMTEQYVMKVAVEGAKVLDDSGPTMTKIYAQVNQLLHKAGPQPEEVAVLDYDTPSLLLESNRGVLKWCHNEQLKNCREIRRFRI